MLNIKPESGTQVGIEPTGLNVNLALEEGTPDVSRNPTSDSSFPDRVRFNWGFHDGTAEAERAKVREMDQHPDRTYAAGYVRGVLAWKNLGYRPETSDEAWSTFQMQPGVQAGGKIPESPMLKVEVSCKGDVNGDGGFSRTHEFPVSAVEAHHGIEWAVEDAPRQMSLAADYALYAFYRRHGDNRELRAHAHLTSIEASRKAGKMSENSLTSRKLAEQYSVKGAMPHAVVHQLYQLREAEVEALSRRSVLKEADLRELDRGGRAVVASMLYSKCDDAARHALLHDEHPHVRSAAAISRADLEQRPEGKPTALSVDI